MSTKEPYTPIIDIPKIRETVLYGFRSGKTKSIAYRKQQLLRLGYMVQDNQKRLHNTLLLDLGRPPQESDFSEIGPLITDVKLAYDNVEKWARTERAPFSFSWFAMSPTIRKEPKGVVLIIGPFNFPIFSTLLPLVGAIAAGNAAIVKPSEVSSATGSLLAELFPKYLDPDMYRIVYGGVPETTALLELHWDHIMYTGSGQVARVVAAAAAKHLTPLTTELGGKSPTVIDEHCDMEAAARRVMWGKTFNTGQVCLSPDYVLIPEHCCERFVAAVKQVLDEWYPEGPAKSDSFGRMVTVAHTERVKKLIDATKGTIVLGGQVDVSAKYIAPTVVTNVTIEDSLMSEEIFGPVLPIVSVKDVDEAISIINRQDIPLALYIFSNDSSFKAKVMDNTQSGGVTINDVFLHCGAQGLPFGGLGPSGSGYYTGKSSFDTFSHLRSTIDSPIWLDRLGFNGRFAPYTDAKFSWIKMMLFPSLPARPAAVPKL